MKLDILKGSITSDIDAYDIYSSETSVSDALVLIHDKLDDLVSKVGTIIISSDLSRTFNVIQP